MATADEVVVEFEAKIGKYEADLKRAQKTFEQSTRSQEQRMQSFERQMRQSSGQIGSTLKGLAATFAAAFSAQQVQQMADSYTRFTNQLRVAGLEGQALGRVQERLFEIAQQNGVETEALGTLYSRAAQSAAELGASQGQLLQFTEAVSASLKISGTSASEAGGALLQLGQALGSPRVQAEEFNSLLDTMQPLLREAAKEIEGTGGTLGGLTRLLKDTQGPGVSNVQLFNAIIASLQRLEATASTSTLTIGQSFQTLNNALGKYIGETDDALSATERISQAIALLADNLDTVMKALAAVSVVMLSRYVGGLTAGGVATRALVAHLQVATTSLAGTALAARSAGAALASALGGPVGLAVLALAAGIYYLSTRTEELTAAAKAKQNATERAAEADRVAAVAAEQLANANARQRAEIIAAMKASRARAAQSLQTAKAQLVEARAALAVAQANARKDIATASLSTRGAGGGIDPLVVAGDRRQRNVAPIEQAVDKAEKLFAKAAGALDGLDKAIRDAGAPVKLAPTGVDEGKTKKTKNSKGPTGSTGPTAEEIEGRYLDELDSLRSQMAGAEVSIARSADERAELELRQLENARRQTLRSLDADEDYSEAQKARVRAAVEAVALAEREVIEFNRRAAGEREAADFAGDEYRAREERLRLEYDLATTEAQRRDIALRILDAEDAYLRAKLEAVIASETATEAEQERARIALASLENTAGARRRVVDRANQGPLGRYADSMVDPAARVEEAVARKLQAVNEGISDALTDALGTDDQFVKDLFSIFLDQVIFRPLAEALGQADGIGGGGGLGGAIGSIVGNAIMSIFGGGKAIGGPVRAGVPYKVGEGGEEMFVPQQNGVIVPNHRLKAQGGGTTVIAPNYDLRGAMVTEQVLAELDRRSRMHAREAASGAYRQSMKDAPSAVQRAQRYGR